MGVIGYGYWGPNLVRNLAELDNAIVAMVCDQSEERCKAVANRYPSVTTTTNANELIESANIDAVVIATPVRSHFDLSLQALKSGKHVLVEKPITQSADQAQILIEEADTRNLILMTDHTFLYTGAVRKIRDLIDSGELGDIYYYDSTRINLGLFQHDVDVIWDLAIHDLSILNFLLKQRPLAVSATGAAHISGQVENVAYLTIYLEGGAIAHVNVNWMSPIKIRQTLIGGSKRMVVYDDLEPSEKIRVYDKGVTLTEDPESVHQMLVGYRTGDMWAPQISTREALQVEVEHFIECINTSGQPISDGRSGLEVVKIAEAATQSMRRRGEPVEIG